MFVCAFHVKGTLIVHMSFNFLPYVLCILIINPCPYCVYHTIFRISIKHHFNSLWFLFKAIFRRTSNSFKASLHQTPCFLGIFGVLQTL